MEVETIVKMQMNQRREKRLQRNDFKEAEITKNDDQILF